MADGALLQCTTSELTDYLARAWEDWEAAGLPATRARTASCPTSSPPRPLLGLRARAPALADRARRPFAYDTMTLIGPGTWEAARAAIDTAVTAPTWSAPASRPPTPLPPARPPRHALGFGGSCYLNNSAAAAPAAAPDTGRAVAVIDIDAHHGNGTQAIFCDDTEVLTGSVHVDPGAGWFPTSSASPARPGGGRQPQPAARPGLERRALARGRGELTGWARDAARRARGRARRRRRGRDPRARSR